MYPNQVTLNAEVFTYLHVGSIICLFHQLGHQFTNFLACTAKTVCSITALIADEKRCRSLRSLGFAAAVAHLVQTDACIFCRLCQILARENGFVKTSG